MTEFAQPLRVIGPSRLPLFSSALPLTTNRFGEIITSSTAMPSRLRTLCLTQIRFPTARIRTTISAPNHRRLMLNENEIVEAMCRDLTKSGYQILQKCSTTMKGIDIIAKHPSQPGRLLIEAKGGTSARSGSPRFDKGFNSSQVHDRVAKGLYAAADEVVE